MLYAHDYKKNSNSNYTNKIINIPVYIFLNESGVTLRFLM